jgi:hypothetical protein
LVLILLTQAAAQRLAAVVNTGRRKELVFAVERREAAAHTRHAARPEYESEEIVDEMAAKAEPSGRTC